MNSHAATTATTTGPTVDGVVASRVRTPRCDDDDDDDDGTLSSRQKTDSHMRPFGTGRRIEAPLVTHDDAPTRATPTVAVVQPSTTTTTMTHPSIVGTPPHESNEGVMSSSPSPHHHHNKSSPSPNGRSGTIAATTTTRPKAAAMLPLKKRPFRHVLPDPLHETTTHRDDEDGHHPPPTKLRRLVASYWSRCCRPPAQSHGDDWEHSRTMTTTAATTTTTAHMATTRTRSQRLVDWNDITKQAPASGSYLYEEQYNETMTETSGIATANTSRFRRGRDGPALDHERTPPPPPPLGMVPVPRLLTPSPPISSFNVEPTTESNSRARNRTKDEAVATIRPLGRHFVPLTGKQQHHQQPHRRWMNNDVSDHHIHTKDDDDDDHDDRFPHVPSGTEDESTHAQLPMLSFRHIVDSTIFMDHDNVEDDEELVEMEATATTSRLDSPTSSSTMAYPLPSITPSPNPTQQQQLLLPGVDGEARDTSTHAQHHFHHHLQHRSCHHRPLPIVPDTMVNDAVLPSTTPSVSMMIRVSRRPTEYDLFDVHPTPLREGGWITPTPTMMNAPRSSFWTKPTATHVPRHYKVDDVVVVVDSSNRPEDTCGTTHSIDFTTLRPLETPQLQSPSDRIVPGSVETFQNDDTLQHRSPTTHPNAMTTLPPCPKRFDSVATTTKLPLDASKREQQQQQQHKLQCLHTVSANALTTAVSFIPRHDPFVHDDSPSIDPTLQGSIERNTERVECNIPTGLEQDHHHHQQQQQPPLPMECSKPPEYELNFPPEEPVRSDSLANVSSDYGVGNGGVDTDVTMNDSINACSSKRTGHSADAVSAGQLTSTSSLSTSSGLSHCSAPASETMAAISYPLPYNLSTTTTNTTTKRHAGCRFHPPAYDHPLYTSHLAANGRRVQSAFAPGRIMKTPRHMYERTEI